MLTERVSVHNALLQLTTTNLIPVCPTAPSPFRRYAAPSLSHKGRGQ